MTLSYCKAPGFHCGGLPILFECQLPGVQLGHLRVIQVRVQRQEARAGAALKHRQRRERRHDAEQQRGGRLTAHLPVRRARRAVGHLQGVAPWLAAGFVATRGGPLMAKPPQWSAPT